MSYKDGTMIAETINKGGHNYMQIGDESRKFGAYNTLKGLIADHNVSAPWNDQGWPMCRGTLDGESVLIEFDSSGEMPLRIHKEAI